MTNMIFDYGTLLTMGVLAVMGVVRHPSWSMYGYYIVALMRVNEMSHTLFPMRLSMGLVGATIVGFGVMAATQGIKKVRSVPLMILGVMLIHMWYSGRVLSNSGLLADPAGHWRQFDYYWKMAMMAWIGSKVFSHPTHLARATWVLAFCGAYLALWQNHRYFIQYANPPLAGPGPHIGLYAGLFADRNNFAMMFSMSVPLFWYQAQLSKSRYFKLAWLAMIPISMHAVLLTESRGGLLGILTAFGYIAWHSKRRVLMGFAGLVGMVLFVAFFATEKMLKRYGTITKYEADPSAMGRKMAWRVGIRMALANPFWGRGMNNFVAAYYEYEPAFQLKHKTLDDGTLVEIHDLEWEIYRAKQAHNMWVQTAGELGLLGVILLMAFIISAIVTTRFLIRSKIKAIGDRGPPGQDLLVLHRLVESPFVPYLITGFFLSMQHFEFMFVMGSLASAYNGWLKRYLEALESGEIQSPTDGEVDSKAADSEASEGASTALVPRPTAGPLEQAPATTNDEWAHFPPPRR